MSRFSMVKLDARNWTWVDDEVEDKGESASIANRSVPNWSIPSLPDCMDVNGRIAWSFRNGSPSASSDTSLLFIIGMTTDEKRSPYGSFPDAPAVKIRNRPAESQTKRHELCERRSQSSMANSKIATHLPELLLAITTNLADQ